MSHCPSARAVYESGLHMELKLFCFQISRPLVSRDSPGAIIAQCCVEWQVFYCWDRLTPVLVRLPYNLRSSI